jgi:hypothetical protein
MSSKARAIVYFTISAAHWISILIFLWASLLGWHLPIDDRVVRSVVAFFIGFFSVQLGVLFFRAGRNSLRDHQHEMAHREY